MNQRIYQINHELSKAILNEDYKKSYKERIAKSKEGNIWNPQLDLNGNINIDE